MMTKFSLYVAVALCVAISGCGGGGSGTSTPAATIASSVIRFVGNFQPGCGGCSPATPGSLVIAPLAGTTTIGNREIAKVELSVDQGTAMVLTAPNAKTAAGQASYAFSFLHTAFTTPAFTHVCTPQLSLAITVTDVSGFSFKKSYSTCRTDEFGAFSDYGEKVIAYKASSNAPMQMGFSRFGAGQYIDSGSISGTANIATTLKAKDSDVLNASGAFDGGVADGAVLSISMEGEGNMLASSTVAKKSTAQVSAMLVCCGPSTAAPLSTGTQTITFAISTARYNEPVTDRPNPFNVYFRVMDPSTGTVVSEFRGAGAGPYTEWPVTVKAGYELKLEASPQEADTYVHLYIGRGAPAYQNTLGEAISNRPDAQAKLNVFCCKR
jgi:hypothetical protein